MAKDPAFLFYPGDWQGGTSTFSRFLKGCYLDVLIAQFNSGHLSLEEIKTVLGSDFGQAWPTLQKKFQKDGDGLLFNEKLDTEIIRRKEYSKSRSDNRSGKGKKTHEKHMLNISNTYVPHMETETETGIKKKKELDIFNSLFGDELFVEHLNRAHKGKDIKQAFSECFIHWSNAKTPPSDIGEWKQKLNTWLSNKRPGRQTKTNYKVQ
jgi:hypothetical protein